MLEKPVQPFPRTVVKEPANIVPAEPLPKIQPETISKVSGDNSAGVSAVSVPAEAQVKISAETLAKISAETQVRARAEPLIESPARLESPVKTLNEKALSGETTQAGITLNTATVNTAASLKVQTAVSLKPEPKSVLGVIGMSLEKAVSLLGAQGIKVGTISEAISTAAAGTVISQNPGAGSTVNLSVPINLVVAKQATETQPRSSILSRLKL